MGCMSASDAAPLPRLGEVFFDVRGDSRSMRLSWYADTGVAVFSIWQGGTCTGTFRLPIDDLARMVEALRRGPQPKHRRPDTSRPELPGPEPQRRDDEAARADGVPGAGADPGPPTVAMRLPSAVQPETGYHAGPEYPGEQPFRDYHGSSAAGDYADPLAGGDYQSAADYRDPLAGGDYPSTADYRDHPADGDYPAPGDYRDGPATGEYPATGDYRDTSVTGYPAESPFRDYHDVPATGDYHRYDPATGDYRDGPAGPYHDDPAAGSYHDGPAEPPRPGYPGEPAFRDYPPQPAADEYPGEPHAGGPAHDYDQPGRDWDDTDGHTHGGFGEEPSPESFPYGPPPGNREPRERGRYPGRH